MKFSTAIARVRRDGFRVVLWRRLRWYSERIRGTFVTLAGNKVGMDGMTYSVAPFRSTLKSTLSKGRHEESERDLVRRWLPADIPIVELGGGMGAVSCLANRKLKDPSRHVVVEADPAMVPLLEENRDRNGCRFTVISRALGYDCPTISFDRDPDFVGSSVAGVSGASGKFEARTTTVAQIMDEHRFEICGIICDIEGSEVDLIQREFSQLGARIRFILAEFHPHVIGREVTERLFEILRQLGFEEKQSIGNCAFYARAIS